MSEAPYIALSGARAFERQVEMIANNIANVGTSGFKADRVSFAEMLEPDESGESPREGGRFVDVAGNATDFTPGPLRRTDSPFDIAIAGDGFLKVEADPNEPGAGPRFWRGGGLSVRSSDGALVTTTGHAVLSATGGAIFMGEQAPLEITGDGRVIARRGREREELGQLAFVGLEAPGQQLIKRGDGLFDALPGQVPDEVPPSGALEQGAIERSNVNPTRAMVELIAANRAFDLVQRFQERWRRMDERLMTQVLMGR